MIRAVTFDFWNTLMYELPGELRDRRLQAWVGLLEEEGVTGLDLEAAHRRAHERHLSEWAANRQFQVADAVDHLLDGLDLGPRVRARFIESFSTAGDATDLQLAAGVGECLRALHDLGVGLGIVSDIGLTPSPVLRRHLERAGLLELFRGQAFSDEVGWYKPAPQIFAVALEGLGIDDPREVAHVGDRRRTDVAGALGMGMTAVRYSGVFDDDLDPEPEAPIIVADYAELLPALGWT